MYLAVDVGGTKTLVALLADDGQIIEQRRFKSSPDYAEFLQDLRQNFEQLEHRPEGPIDGCAGIPGFLDRDRGIVHVLGNLPWQDKPIRDDIANITGGRMIIDNDANLGGLSEAMLHKECETVLYFTVSTGIGTGLIRQQRIDPAFIKSEGGHMVLPHEGKLEDWESFASGKAIAQRYGKPAAEITEQDDWRTIAHDLALGFFNHIALVQPDLIVIGGSIGTHFNHYKDYLLEELRTFERPIVPIPAIVEAERPEEAVIFGCYDLARQVFSNE
ncbi:MAG TPA: ROK family protein [Candidatus Saccharimonadales bacterium]|nr:ROK family protein [Candidatus Saccharimonadales bacterium]